MSMLDEFLTMIESNIIKPLLEIEETYQGIVEDWAAKVGVERPKVVVTLQETNECSHGLVCEDDECRLVTGIYVPETGTLVVNYKSTPDVLLHLFVHHIQARQVGVERFSQMRQSEMLRLPWSLRPSEIKALFLTNKLRDSLLTQRVMKLWVDYVKPQIKKIDEENTKVRSTVNNLIRTALPNAQIRHHGFTMLRGNESDRSRSWKDKARL